MTQKTDETGITRRAGLGLMAGAALASGTQRANAQAAEGGSGGFPPVSGETLFEDVKTYDAFGHHRAGSDADRQTGEWIAGRLEKAGFSIETHRFPVPVADSLRADLRLDGTPVIDGHAQWPVSLTGPDGLSAPLALFNPYAESQDLTGRIAVIDLPYRRHSSLMSPVVMTPLRQAVAAGAVGVTLIPTGPSETLIALNAPVSLEGITIPLLVIAPKDSEPVLRAASRGARATLTIDGPPLKTGTARNVVGRYGDKGRWIVVSTPQSGWFHCAAERGPGIAVFLALADRLPALDLPNRLLFVSNSGHELENAGAEHALDAYAPDPDDTALWVHLGAGLAARDFQVFPPYLIPLPSADSRRILMGTPDLLPGLKTAFRGVSGLENVLPATAETAAGELKTVLEAGYTRVFGGFGGHMFHHSPEDRPDKTGPDLLAPMAAAMLRAVYGFVHNGVE